MFIVRGWWFQNFVGELVSEYVDSTQCVLVIVTVVVIAPTMTAMASTRPFCDYKAQQNLLRRPKREMSKFLGYQIHKYGSFYVVIISN